MQSGRPQSSQIKLRDYQDACLTAVGSALASGQSPLVVMATGTGKTVMFAELARRTMATAGNRVMVVAHRDELLDQAADKLRAVGLTVGFERSGDRAADAPCVVTSIQSLARRRAQYADDTFALVIVDEAHHITLGGSYEHALSFSCPVLGVTATPERMDGRGLVPDIFDREVFRYDLPDATRDGHLVPLVSRRIVVKGMSLDDVPIRGGDYGDGELGRKYLEAHMQAVVAHSLARYAGGRQALVFVPDVASIGPTVEACERMMMTADGVDGRTPKEQRHDVIARYRSGQLDVLVGCGVFTEGFDAPETSCIVMARPTRSATLYLQCIGRGTRLAEGKRDCLVLEMVAHRPGKMSAITTADVAPSKMEDRVVADTPITPDATRYAVTFAGDEDVAALERENRARAERMEAHRKSMSVWGRSPMPSSTPSDLAFLDAVGWSVRFGENRATDKQRAACIKMTGIDPKVVGALDTASCTDVFRLAKARDALGLCSLRDARFLYRWRLPLNVTPSAAQVGRKGTAQIKAGGWGSKAVRALVIEQMLAANT